jgi:hypothetical protein
MPETSLRRTGKYRATSLPRLKFAIGDYNLWSIPTCAHRPTVESTMGALAVVAGVSDIG